MIDKNTPAADDAMTIRAYLASAALQGILANPNWNQLSLSHGGASQIETFNIAGRLSTMYADATITALNKSE